MQFVLGESLGCPMFQVSIFTMCNNLVDSDWCLGSSAGQRDGGVGQSLDQLTQGTLFRVQLLGLEGLKLQACFGT